MHLKLKMPFNNIKIKPTLLFILLLVICYFVLFLHLGALTIRMWDESFYATESLEMSQNGNLIVKYFDDRPHMINTKPPMINWLQVISMKIFGYNEIAIRLPSAIAALLTALLLYRFCIKEFNSYLWGFVSALVLVTSNGYVHHHITRTGDTEALLTLWVAVTTLYYYKFLKYDHKKYLIIITISLIFAALTKGISGLLCLPGLFLFTVFQQKIKKVFLTPSLYFSIASFLAIVLGYYFLRDYYNPGYLKVVLREEVGGIYFETYDNHKEDFLFYFNNLFDWKFTPWVYCLPLGFLIGIFKKDAQLKNITILSALSVFVHLLIISIAETKLPWYDAHIYPMASLLAGLGIWQLCDSIKKSLSFPNKKITEYFVLLTLLVVLFIEPYKKIIDKIFAPKDTWRDVKYGYLMKQIYATKPDIKKYFFAGWEYNHHILFYKTLYNKIMGYDINLKNIDQFKEGDLVLTCYENTKEIINQKYDYTIIDSREECILIMITKIK